MATRHPRRPGPDLTEQARRAGVRLVRFLYTDNGGITRGKATHLDGLAHRLTDGIGLTVAMQAMNMLDQLQSVEGLGPVGEIRLIPDPRTFTPLPYAPHAAAMTSDMCTLEGAPWEACPRAFLKRQIAACGAAGFSVRAAFECEFTLAVKQADGGFAPLDQSLCFSTIGMTTAAPVMDDVVAALEAQRIPVEQSTRSSAMASRSCRSGMRRRSKPPIARSSIGRPCGPSLIGTASWPRSRPSLSSIRPATARISISACGTPRAADRGCTTRRAATA